MAFNKMPIISKPNVDAYGNPQLVQVVSEPHEIFKSKLVLNGVPDKFSRVTITDEDATIYVEKFDTDILTGNQFKVNYSDGVINFPVTLEGKSVLVNYYSKGIELVSAERIYTKLGDNGDVVETLDDKVAEMQIIKQNYDNATHVEMVSKVILEYIATQDTTSFVLNANNYNPLIDIVWMYYKNTILLENKQYVITGTTVTLNDWTLPTGDTIDIVIERAVKDLPPAGGNGGDLMLGSVGENKLSSDVQLKLNKTLVIQDYTFTATQDNTTTFTIASDIFNSNTDTLDIYKENLKLSKDVNYSLTGQIVTLATALDIGDFVEYRITKNTANSVPFMPDGSLLQNKTIAKKKLTQDLQNEITNKAEKTYVDLINTEITNARNGKATLKAEIDTINSSLTDISKFSKVIRATGTDDTANIQAALNSYGDILLPDDNYYITSTLILKPNQRIYGNTNTVIHGNGCNVEWQGTYDEPFLVTNFTSNAITLSSMTGFDIVAGDIVNLVGQYVSVFSEVVSVDTDNKTVTIADIIDFSITGTLNLYKSINANITIENLTFDNVKFNLYNNTYNGRIRNCKFINNSKIALSHLAYFTIENNDFNGTDDSIFTYDCSFINIIKNKIINFNNAIRNQYPYGFLIQSNTVKNGKSTYYSVGIEITGSNGVNATDKSSNNKIIGNTVINANKGVPGSANGGIHLNFNSHNNIIENNISNQNGIGIYLENANYSNIIKGNICNYNGGYYGVGIELDWDNTDIIIDGNICNYNKGSLEADESCGIEVRSGLSTGHTCKNIIITNNNCEYNGKNGIWVNGLDIICNSNTVKNNGTGTFASKNQIYATDNNGLVMIGNTIVDTTGVNNNAIYISNPTNVKINNNKIHVTNVTNSIVFLTGLFNVVDFSNNEVIGDANQRLVYLNGSSNSKYLYAKSNIIKASGDNGYYALEIDNMDTYQQKDNILIANTRIIEYQCTNKIS